MVIGLVGYYGYQNYGDEIFLEIWKKLLGEQCAVILPETNIQDVDKIIIGGGDLIWHGAFNNNYFNEKWYEDGKKVYVYGVGVADPNVTVFQDPNVFNLYKNFLSRAQYVSARDEKSAEWLTSILGIHNVVWVEDLAWNYTPRVSVKKKELTAGLTYRRNPIFDTDDISLLVSKLIDTGTRCRLIPLQNGYYNTHTLHKIILDTVNKDVSYPSINIDPSHYNTQHKYASITSCNYYMTLTFHGLLTALKERVPVLSMMYDNKFTTLLNRCGMSNVLTDKKNQHTNLEYLLSKDYTFSDTMLKNIEQKAKEDLSYFINSVVLK